MSLSPSGESQAPDARASIGLRNGSMAADVAEEIYAVLCLRGFSLAVTDSEVAATGRAYARIAATQARRA